MKKPTTHAACAGIAALLCGCLATPAQADLVFRFHNLSQVEAKGVMQNIGIVWLRRQQVEEVRHKGDWSGHCGPIQINCAKILNDNYTANFENLSNAGEQYCVWNIKRTIHPPKNGALWGSVELTTRLTHEHANYKCTYGGQWTSGYNSDNQGKGLTVDFSVVSK